MINFWTQILFYFVKTAHYRISKCNLEYKKIKEFFYWNRHLDDLLTESVKNRWYASSIIYAFSDFLSRRLIFSY